MMKGMVAVLGSIPHAEPKIDAGPVCAEVGEVIAGGPHRGILESGLAADLPCRPLDELCHAGIVDQHRRVFHDGDCARSAVHQRNAIGQFCNALVRYLPYLFVSSTNGATDECAVGDDVWRRSSADHSNRHDQWNQRARIVRPDLGQLADQAAGRSDGVDTLMRLAAMAGSSSHRDIKVIRGAGVGAGPDGDLAGRQLGVNVDSKDRVAVVQTSGIQELLGTTWQILLRMLKQNSDETGERCPVSVEMRGSSKSHGGVGVMPAGVHHAIDLGAKWEPCLLLDRQSIHISPDSDGSAATISLAENID